MKLPPFEYEAPTTAAEAIDLLAEHLDEASVLAGGQSLIPLLALRLARPAVLIDINGIDELSGVSATDGWVTIGATTRDYVAEESETVAEAVPLLAAALPLIGHEAIRSRGTIGGSLAHADPAAELPAVARALDAEFVVRGPSGERVVPAAEWFEGYLTTSRGPDELLVEVRFPAKARVSYETGPREPVMHQQVWVIEGAIDITVGDERHRLGTGDCVAMVLDKPITFHNPHKVAARYAVVLASMPYPLPFRRSHGDLRPSLYP